MMAVERIPLERGQQVMLRVDESDGARWFPTRVMGREDDTVWVGAPPHDPAGALAVGEEVSFRTWRATDALYAVRAEIVAVERGAQACVGVWVFEGERIQRREYFRVPCWTVLKGATVIAPDGEEQRPRLLLADLSASGLGLRSAAPLALGSELRLDLSLPDNGDVVPVRASIVRAEASRDHAEYPWECGAMFTDVATVVRERIIRHAIRYQLEQLRRGVV
ncbi:MAG TPA: PilZ domain-containing protein [Chloroflexota bacterium]|nr:PilZ domain-containing protein [Chloroflexota bacterium]